MKLSEHLDVLRQHYIDDDLYFMALKLEAENEQLKAELLAKGTRIAELDVKIVLLMGESERAKEERDSQRNGCVIP